MSFRAVEYIDELVAAGVPDAQAKAQVRILQDLRDSELVTKKDLALAKRDIIITLGGIVVACASMLGIGIAALGFLIKS